MMRRIVTFDLHDILVIPFPFVDSSHSKPRPVIVLTNADFNGANGHCVAAMITTASRSEWAGDTPIRDLEVAGLKHSSVIRMKMFTLDVRIGARKIGELSDKDKKAFLEHLGHYTSF